MANSTPIYSRAGDIQGVQLQGGLSTRSDGAGTGNVDLYPAANTDPISGGFVRDISFWPTANTAGTAMTPTTLRAFFTTVGPTGSTTVTNCFPLGEVAMTAQSADNSTGPIFPVTLTINRALPPGNIMVSQHVAPATNTRISCVVTLGKY